MQTNEILKKAHNVLSKQQFATVLAVHQDQVLEFAYNLVKNALDIEVNKCIKHALIQQYFFDENEALLTLDDVDSCVDDDLEIDWLLVRQEIKEIVTNKKESDANNNADYNVDGF